MMKSKLYLFILLLTSSCTVIKLPYFIEYSLSPDKSRSILYLTDNIAISQWKQQLPGDSPRWQFDIVKARRLTKTEKKQDESFDPSKTGSLVEEVLVYDVSKICYVSDRKCYLGLGSRPRPFEEALKYFPQVWFIIDSSSNSCKFITEERAMSFKSSKNVRIEEWHMKVIDKNGWEAASLSLESDNR